MKLELRPNEQVLYPSPYVEEEPNPLIISTLRLIWHPTGKKKREIDADKIHYSGKGFHRRFMTLMILFGLLGAPLFGVGAYTYYTYKDKPTERPAAVKGVPQKPPTKKELEDYQHNKQQQILGIALLIPGAALLGIAYLLYRRRLTVVIGGGGKAFAIPVKDKMTQDKILTMLGAAQTSAKALAVPAMPAKVAKLGVPKPPKLFK